MSADQGTGAKCPFAPHEEAAAPSEPQTPELAQQQQPGDVADVPIETSQAQAQQPPAAGTPPPPPAPAAAKPAAGGDTIDLNALDSAPKPAARPRAAPASSYSTNTSTATDSVFHHAPLGTPNFKVFFDFLLVNRPGLENLSFDSFHTFLFFELLPTPDIQFSFDISPQPKFFELDTQVNKRLQFRVGKIWIPFDDMAPHNLFGGRVNTSRLAIGSAFLPDIWTDLGAGFKLQIFDSPKFAMELHGYIVNGFHDGGTDLANPTSGPSGYPSFADLTIGPDNNRDKAIGGRVHMLIYNRLGIGASYYTGQWNADTGAPALRLNILGIDSQLRIGPLELRGGLCAKTWDLPAGSPVSTTANGGGDYVEAGLKFGGKREWKFLARAGTIQLDDRVVDITDQRIVGGALLYQPGLIQYSIESSRDLKEADGKKNYSYTAARMVMAF